MPATLINTNRSRITLSGKSSPIPLKLDNIYINSLIKITQDCALFLKKDWPMEDKDRQDLLGFLRSASEWLPTNAGTDVQQEFISALKLKIIALMVKCEHIYSAVEPFNKARIVRGTTRSEEAKYLDVLKNTPKSTPESTPPRPTHHALEEKTPTRAGAGATHGVDSDSDNYFSSDDDDTDYGDLKGEFPPFPCANLEMTRRQLPTSRNPTPQLGGQKESLYESIGPGDQIQEKTSQLFAAITSRQSSASSAASRPQSSLTGVPERGHRSSSSSASSFQFWGVSPRPSNASSPAPTSSLLPKPF